MHVTILRYTFAGHHSRLLPELAQQSALSTLVLAGCGGGGDGSTKITAAEARVCSKEKAVTGAEADLADTCSRTARATASLRACRCGRDLTTPRR